MKTHNKTKISSEKAIGINKSKRRLHNIKRKLANKIM